MTFEAKQGFVRIHALSVIFHSHVGLTTIAILHLDLRRPGINAVFHQFLDHRLPRSGWLPGRVKYV